MLRAVRRYQTARMRRTHEALLRAAGYGPLCEFVLGEIYDSPALGAWRASALSRLFDLLRPALPESIREGALGVLDLYALSEQLDDRLARTLLFLGATASFSTEEFEVAYYRCDDYADRLRQIDLAEASTRFGLTLGRDGSFGILSEAAHAMSELPRLGPLLSLAERACQALSEAGEIERFVRLMRAGETGYLEGVYVRQRTRPALVRARSRESELAGTPELRREEDARPMWR